MVKPRAAIFILLHRNPTSNMITSHRHPKKKLIKCREDRNPKLLYKKKRFDIFHILSTLSALITGLAFEIASRPTSLKSKLHSCFSGYLWLPQNVLPHLHLNPITPTFLLQLKHLFVRAGFDGSASSCPVAIGADHGSAVTTTEAGSVSRGCFCSGVIMRLQDGSLSEFLTAAFATAV